MRRSVLLFACVLGLGQSLAGCGDAFQVGGSGSSGAGGGATASATGQGGGASSTSAAGGGTAASSSSSGGGEDCTNGSDDDQDGQVDCMDPDCQAGFACVPVPPPGWSGPTALWKGPVGGAPPCGVGFTSSSEGSLQLDAPPAVCGCTCGEPQGGQCSLTTLKLYVNDDVCGGQATATLQGPAGFCTAPNLVVVGVDSAKASPTPASGGACAPSASVDVPPYAFAKDARSCLAEEHGAGCAGQALCAPKAPFGFQGTLCVEQAGDLMCPPGYPQKTVMFGAVDDARGCAPCTCEGATGQGCKAGVDLFAAANCTSPQASFSNDDQCATFASSLSVGAFLVTASGPPEGGSCMPSDPKPVGTATPQAPTTVCCLP